MTYMETMFLAGGLLLAGVAKGATGIGTPVIGIPLLSAVIQVRRAIGLITLPLVITNIAQAIEGGEISKHARRLVFPIIAFVSCCFLSFKLLFALDEHLSEILAAAMLLAAATVTLLSRRGVQFWERRYTNLVGSASGACASLLAGLSGVAGPPVFLYLLGFDMKPAQFTKSVAIFLLAANAIMALLLVKGAHMDTNGLFESLIATAPVFFGMLIGQSIRDRIPSRVFRKVVLAMVFAAGAQLTCRGLVSFLS